MTALAVNHSEDHDLTVQGVQGACGWALHLLATERHRVTGLPLPRLTWVVAADDPRLSGWALSDLGAARSMVEQWAAHLGVEVTEQRRGGETYIDAISVAHGVPVRVWACFPAVEAVV